MVTDPLFNIKKLFIRRLLGQEQMRNFARSVIVVLKKGVCLRKFRPHNILILHKLLSNAPATNAYS